MNDKSMLAVMEKIKSMVFEERFDLIVAIANGGIIPAALLSQCLNVKVELLRINLRNSNQQPLYDKPKLLEKPVFLIKGQSILLVEDRVKTGATINFAKEIMKEAALIKTFAVNGNADYSLYNEACFKFPWIIST